MFNNLKIEHTMKGGEVKEFKTSILYRGDVIPLRIKKEREKDKVIISASSFEITVNHPGACPTIVAIVFEWKPPEQVVEIISVDYSGDGGFYSSMAFMQSAKSSIAQAIAHVVG